MMTAHTPASTGETACVTCGATLSAAATTCSNCGTVRVRPATIAARMAALTLDVAAVAIVASVVLLSTRSLAFAAVAATEAALALWILQARAGLSLGNLVMRLRTARVDKPYSPGGGRALLRGACTAAGLAVLAVGAWLLELTGVADRTGWRRSWADRAAGTMVVEVPRVAAQRAAEAATAASAAPAAPAPAAPAGPFVARPATFAPAASARRAALITDVPAGEVTVPPAAAGALPQSPAPTDPDVPGPRRSTAVPPPVGAPAVSSPGPWRSPAPAPATPAPAAAAAASSTSSATPPAAAPAPAAASTPPQAATPPPGSRRARRAATGDVPVMPPAPGPRRSTASPMSAGGQTVLFAFDTGQRLEAPVPCAVVLGRHPSPMEDGDLVITVDDPQRTVSSLHARLEVGADDAWVTDLDSTNGSDLLTEDGAARRIAPQQRVRVEDGTRVRIGDRTVTMTRLAGDSV